MKIFLILFIFIFFPIPLKFYIYYNNSNYYIKLYKLTLFDNEKLKKKREKKSHTRNIPPNNNQRDKKHKIREHKKFNIKEIISFSFIKNSIHKFHNLKFKPILLLTGEVSYSFSDAARTAISYGSLCTLPSIINFFINIIFKVKKYDFKIIPVFEDKFILRLETKSIIFISLANIIYMIFIFLIYLLKNKNLKSKQRFI